MDQDSTNSGERRNWRERLGIAKENAKELPKISEEFRSDNGGKANEPRLVVGSGAGSPGKAATSDAVAPPPMSRGQGATPVRPAPMAPRPAATGGAVRPPQISTQPTRCRRKRRGRVRPAGRQGRRQCRLRVRRSRQQRRAVRLFRRRPRWPMARGSPPPTILPRGCGNSARQPSVWPASAPPRRGRRAGLRRRLPKRPRPFRCHRASASRRTSWQAMPSRHRPPRRQRQRRRSAHRRRMALSKAGSRRRRCNPGRRPMRRRAARAILMVSSPIRRRSGWQRRHRPIRGRCSRARRHSSRSPMRPPRMVRNRGAVPRLLPVRRRHGRRCRSGPRAMPGDPSRAMATPPRTSMPIRRGRAGRCRCQHARRPCGRVRASLRNRSRTSSTRPSGAPSVRPAGGSRSSSGPRPPTTTMPIANMTRNMPRKSRAAAAGR